MAQARIQIRRATSDDAAAISALTSRLALRHIVPDCSAAGAARLLASMDAAATGTRLRGDHRAWVAIDAEVHALVAILVLRPPHHLYHLFVADDWQGRGLARRLWAQARTVLLAEGVGMVTVNAARGAVPAYKKLGFHRHGQATGDNDIPSLPMQWLAADHAGGQCPRAAGPDQGDCADCPRWSAAVTERALRSTSSNRVGLGACSMYTGTTGRDRRSGGAYT
ncbi:GNAT family N-acetyltransferase [Lysobacter koreensis]